MCMCVFTDVQKGLGTLFYTSVSLGMGIYEVVKDTYKLIYWNHLIVLIL